MQALKTLIVWTAKQPVSQGCQVALYVLAPTFAAYDSPTLDSILKALAPTQFTLQFVALPDPEQDSISETWLLQLLARTTHSVAASLRVLAPGWLLAC